VGVVAVRRQHGQHALDLPQLDDGMLVEVRKRRLGAARRELEHLYEEAAVGTPTVRGGGSVRTGGAVPSAHAPVSR
jgi:hypothetical protein